MNLAPLIDHTMLSPDATSADIKALCDQAIEHGFAAVCVLPSRVPQCALHLAGSQVKVCTVVGFPHGGLPTRDKVAQAISAIADGAHEIDMVINLGDVKDGNWPAVLDELVKMRAACKDVCLKVIIETGLLHRQDKIMLAKACVNEGVDFVKTSTGSTHGGATVEDVALLASLVGDRTQVKASGGINTAEQARALAAAGATRLGTSRGLAIVGAYPRTSQTPSY